MSILFDNIFYLQKNDATAKSLLENNILSRLLSHMNNNNNNNHNFNNRHHDSNNNNKNDNNNYFLDHLFLKSGFNLVHILVGNYSK